MSRLLTRAIRILNIVADDSAKTAWSVSELSDASGIAPATVYRICTTLEKELFLQKDPRTRSYRLGFRLLELGMKVVTSTDVYQTALPVMRDLAERCRETSSLTVRDGFAAFRIGKHEVSGGFHVAVGERAPLHVGASRRVLLAYMSPEELDTYLRGTDLVAVTDSTLTDPEVLKESLACIRRVGYAISFGERTPGSVGVAAPIYDHESQVVASLSLSVPASRFTDDRQDELTTAVSLAAHEVSRRLGWRDRVAQESS